MVPSGRNTAGGEHCRGVAVSQRSEVKTKDAENRGKERAGRRRGGTVFSVARAGSDHQADRKTGRQTDTSMFGMLHVGIDFYKQRSDDVTALVASGRT